MNHINMAYDRDKWQAVREISWLAQELLASEDGISFLEIWGLFDRASSSWNKVKCRLDATR